jgi:hypothetical protein
MNVTKFFIALFAALSLGFQAAAQVIASGTLAAATSTVISTDGVAILSLQISDTSGSANAVVVYDNDTAASTNIARLQYTSAGSYTTNRVTTFTNRAGVVQSFTNTVLYPYTTTVAAVTNEAPRVLTTVLTANQTQQFNNINADTPLSTTRGLVIRPVGTAVYTITYVPLK